MSASRAITASDRRKFDELITSFVLRIIDRSVDDARAFALDALDADCPAWLDKVRLTTSERDSWPTGEFGGMNLEGAVRLGHRRELEAIDDDAEREATTEALITAAYEQGRALRGAELFEIDAVIDPAETRTWIRSLTRAARSPRWRDDDHRSHVDTW